MSALPIFPGRRQPSIFGASELNCRVRDGNGWTLTAISTDFVGTSFVSFASAFGESSLTPLCLLFQSNSLRWASIGFLGFASSVPFASPCGQGSFTSLRLLSLADPLRWAPLGCCAALPRLLFQPLARLKPLFLPWSAPTPGEWYTFRDSNPGHPD